MSAATCAREGRTGAGVRTEAIHRIIEAQVASRGDDPAIVGADYEVSYRELNSRANGLARHFLAAGLRRCGARRREAAPVTAG